MFRSKGHINNYSVKFLIDTGASTIAMSSVAAKKLGVKYRSGTAVQASTASGIAKGYAIKLDKVKLGNIIVYNVEAIVLEGSFPSEILLGQSFLSRIHMTRKGNKMKLRKMF